MRYTVKCLQRAGLVSTLLFGGVLGGLMAPLPSEAVESRPTLTFQVDTGTVSGNLLNTAGGGAHGSTCTIDPGYSACYTITTDGLYSGTGPEGHTRTFTIIGYGGTARVRVQDKTANSGDIITESNVEFAPVPATSTLVNGVLVRDPVDWGTAVANKGNSPPGNPPYYGELHELKLVLQHTFDWAPSPKTVDINSKYLFALRTSGMFQGRSTSGGLGNASGDFVELVGNGIMGSTSATTPLLGTLPNGYTCSLTQSKAGDVDYCPLRSTLGVAHATPSSFATTPALQQVTEYPSYACDNGGAGNNTCTPTITQTLRAKVYGPDSFIIDSSLDAAGGSCSTGHDLDQVGDHVGTHDDQESHIRSCRAVTNKITRFFAIQTAADNAVFAAVGAEATPVCNEAAGECSPATAAFATIIINKSSHVIGLPLSSADGTFAFTVIAVSGPSVPNQSITTTHPVTNIAGSTGSVSVTVAPGTYTITELPVAVDTNLWGLLSSNCGGGPTTGVVVVAGTTMTCTFDNAFSPIL